MPGRDTLTRIRLLCSALAVTVLIALAAAPNFPSFDENSNEFQNMAAGRWGEVHQPYSSRFLHPMLAAALVRESGCSVDTAFRWIAFAILPLAVGVVALLFFKLEIDSRLLAPVLFGYPLARSFQLICMADLLYTLLLGLFVLLLAYRRFILAGLMLVVLFCARESTLVLGLVAALMVAAEFRSAPHQDNPAISHEPVPRSGRGAGVVAAFLLATAIGLWLNHHIAAKAAGNIHQIDPVIYLMAKVPFNFLQNVMGVRLWSNTYISMHGDHPIVRWALPAWVRAHSGAITDIGINDLSPRFPANCLSAVLCGFGVLLTTLAKEICDKARAEGPTIAGACRRCRAVGRGFADLFAEQPLALRVAGVYGIVTLLIVPLLGSAVLRYVFYAWPAFWLLSAKLFQRNYLRAPRNRRCLAALLVVHLALVWLPLAQGWRDENDRSFRPLAYLAAAIVFQYVAWRLLSAIQHRSTA
jgi:hypothetical protein